MNITLKTLKAAIVLMAAFCASDLTAQEYLPAWEEGYLDIHTISTNQGECQFLVLPDGTTMLIDAGDTAWPMGDNIEWAPMIPDASKPVGERYAEYIRHFSKGLPSEGSIDYVFLTHMHGDHMGCNVYAPMGENGYRLSGLTYLADKFRFGTYVDRDCPKYNYPTEKFFGSFVKELKLMQEHQAKAYGTVVEEFKVGSASQFTLIHNPKAFKKNFHIRNICGEGSVWTGKGEKTRKMYTCPDEKVDENMQSCGVVVHYGDFSFSNLGDISGGNYGHYANKNREFEGQVAKVIGKITVHKPSHHGWKDSSCGELLIAARPDVFLFSSSNKDHPFKKTFERISDPLVYSGEREYYITSDYVKDFIGKKNWEKFKPCGHIVCRVYPGGKTYRMYVLDVFAGDYRIKYQSEIKEVVK